MAIRHTTIPTRRRLTICAKYSYIEEEYFIEGTANRYTTPAMATGTIVDGGHPYKTRVMVRRPATAARFNGTVVVEWINVTPGHDLDIDWLQAHDYWMRTGYAWVGVSAQRVGVEALKVWNANRYGSLDVTDHGTITNDDLSYDVFAQVAQAIRHPGSVNLVPGFRVERIFATGHSQSANRLAIYVNSVHPIAPVFDAVVPHGGGGRIRDDLANVKVFKLLSETDVINNQASVRQPGTTNFRSWEVTGDSHVDTQFTANSRKLTQRDGNPQAPALPNSGGRAGAAGRGGAAPNAPAAERPGPPAGAMGVNTSPCDRAPYSHVPFYQVMNAAFDHLVRWVKDGTRLRAHRRFKPQRLAHRPSSCATLAATALAGSDSPNSRCLRASTPVRIPVRVSAASTDHTTTSMRLPLRVCIQRTPAMWPR